MLRTRKYGVTSWWLVLSMTFPRTTRLIDGVRTWKQAEWPHTAFSLRHPVRARMGVGYIGHKYH